MVVRIKPKAFRLLLPAFGDVPTRRQPQHGGDQMPSEPARRGAHLVGMRLGVNELRGAVDGDGEVQPPLPSTDPGDVEMK